MANDVIADHWHRLKGLLRRRWGRLTDEDLARNGNSVYLAGLIEHHYGICVRSPSARCVISDVTSNGVSRPRPSLS